MFQLAQIVRHRLFDVFVSVLIGRLIIDQNLADLVSQVVTQRANDRITLTIKEER